MNTEQTSKKKKKKISLCIVTSFIKKNAIYYLSSIKDNVGVLLVIHFIPLARLKL